MHAGASGVGLAAIQISKRSGARVAATTRSADKLKALDAVGADLAIDTSRRDFAAEIEQRWGRDAVQVVLDPVGASTLPGDLGALKTGGRIVVLSTMSGSEASLDLALLMRKRARIEACLGPRHGGEDHDPPPRLEDPQVAGKRRRPHRVEHHLHRVAAPALLDLRREIPSGGVDREIRPYRVEGLELVGAARRGGHARAGPLRYLDGREPHAGRTRVHQY